MVKQQTKNQKTRRIFFRNGELLKNDKDNNLLIKKIMEIKNGRK